MTVSVNHVEMHITHGCNLTCEACGQYSNHGFSGRETPDSFRAACALWTKRLAPMEFHVLGGEPTLNPDLCEILLVAREIWPKSALFLVTNGWFLHKHPRLPEVLQRTGTHLHVSIHHDGPEYRAKVAEISELLHSWDVTATLRPSKDEWTRYYQGSGAGAMPFADGNPQASWDNCASRDCLTIHEGKLWKCPPIAYLPMLARKFKLSADWQPYLGYTPLEPTCSMAEVEKFVGKQSESCCGMCPASPQLIQIPSPIRGHSRTEVSSP